MNNLGNRKKEKRTTVSSLFCKKNESHQKKSYKNVYIFFQTLLPFVDVYKI